MSQTVWVSEAMSDPTVMRSFWNDKMESWPYEKVRSFSNGYHFGFLQARDDFPGLLKSSDTVVQDLPPLFGAAGLLVVSERAAVVLRQFDLGNGGLVPVDVMQPDGQTPVSDGPYYFLGFGCQKNCFSPDHTADTKRLQRHEGTPAHFWSLKQEITDGLVAVTQTALVGCDLWIDPYLPRKFFVSSRLFTALKGEKLEEAFHLFSCRVIDTSNVKKVLVGAQQHEVTK
jgi:hypothetical protein